MIMIRLS